MKTLCKALAHIELILGTISSIILAYTLGKKLNYYTYNLERDGTATFIIFVSTMLCVITLWAILYAISEILENQDKIFELLENRGKAAPKSITPICGPLSGAPKASPVRTQVQEQIVKQESTDAVVNDEEWKAYNSWKCPSCKRINSGSVDTCICGTSKPR